MVHLNGRIRIIDLTTDLAEIDADNILNISDKAGVVIALSYELLLLFDELGIVRIVKEVLPVFVVLDRLEVAVLGGYELADISIVLNIR